MIAPIYARKSTLAALIFALVLAVPHVAEAACAWVLWEAPGVRDITRAVPRGAFETRSACLDQMARRALEIDREGQVFMVQCLPDTIDPRGPKGK